MAAETNVRALAPRQVAAPTVRTENLDTLTVAKMLAESGFFGEVKQAGQALAKILAGAELGVGPIASLMGVYYQQGKVTYSANIMASAVKRSGRYSYRIRELTDSVCRLEFSSGSDTFESAFSLEDAKKGQLLDGPNKGNWAKWPRNMLFARAMSNGCKWFCPDVFGGVTPYTPDELGAEVVVSDDGEMRPIQAEDVEPTPDELARAQATVHGPDAATVQALREQAIDRCHALAAYATATKHERAAQIAKCKPESLSDQKLREWVEKLEALFPNVTDDDVANVIDEAF